MIDLNKRALIAGFAAVLLMASVPSIIKLISVNEFEIAIIRLVVGVVGVGLWLAVKKQWQPLSKKQWLILLGLGLTFALHWYTYFKGIKLSTPSIAAIGVSTYGIHLMLLSHWLLGQRYHWNDWVALLLALIGLVMVIPEFNFESSFTLGLVLAVISGFLYACLPIFHQKARELPNAIRAFSQFLFALVPFLLFLPLTNFAAATQADWQGLIYLGIVATLFAHTLWVKATTELPGNVASSIYYLYIPCAVSVSIFLTGESISSSLIVGASLIVAANFLTLVKHRGKVGGAK